MRRLLPLVLLSACAPSWDPPLPSPSPVDLRAWDALPPSELLAAAAQQTLVPRDLLAAVAWHESSFVQDTPDHEHGAPRHGFLGLPDARVDEAARLAGLDAHEVREDREAGLYAAALLLRAEAEATGLKLDAARPGLAWWHAVTAWSGQEEPWMDDEYALDIFATLQEGLEVDLEADGVVTIAAWDLPELEEVEIDEAPEADATDFSGGGVRGFPGRARVLLASSSNYSSRSNGVASIKRIVMHTTEGSYNGAISWFRNPSANVSAHYVVRRSDGQVTQMVPDDRRAWHACNNNDDTIGIEQEGRASQRSTWTPQLVEASAKLTGWLSRAYGVPADRQHIVGHGEIQPRGCDYRSDPGPYFPWASFMRKVRAYRNGTDPGSIDPPSWVKFSLPHHGDTVGNPLFVRVRGKSDVRRMEVWAGARRLARNITDNPEDRFFDLQKLGWRWLKVRGFGRHGDLVGTKRIRVNVKETDDLDTRVAHLTGRQYAFRTDTQGARTVRYWVGDEALRDVHDDRLRVPGPDHLMVARVPGNQRVRTLISRAYDADGLLVGEGVRGFVFDRGAGEGGDWAEAYDRDGHIFEPGAQPLFDRTMRLLSTSMPGSGMSRVRYELDGQPLTDERTGLDHGVPSDFSIWHSFPQSGQLELRVKAYGEDGGLVDARDLLIHVPSPTLDVAPTRLGARRYRLDADAPAGTHRVFFTVDGSPLLAGSQNWAPAPAYFHDVTFATAGVHTLRAEARAQDGTVLSTWQESLDVH